MTRSSSNRMFRSVEPDLRHTLADQRAGGGVMLFEGSAVMVGVATWLLLRLFGERSYGAPMTPTL